MPQRGNILFLILLAVVLFAALAYAVTSSLRGGGKDASSEKMDLLASRIIQNAHLIEQTMVRGQMINNIPDWGFDFWPASSVNNTCTQVECRIYNERGGSVPFLKVAAKYTYNGVDDGTGTTDRDASFVVAKMEGIGTDASDLVLIYFPLKKELCDALNRVGNTNVDATIADIFGGASGSYSGTLTALPIAINAIIGDTNLTMKGKKMGCSYGNDSTAKYRFYYVLLER